MLPLTVTSAPASLTRVFVGRMEIITPALVDAARTAIALDDALALERMGRFLGPIADRFGDTGSTAASTRAALDRVFQSYLRRVTSCE
jgi:hypothetical protein